MTRALCLRRSAPLPRPEPRSMEPRGGAHPLVYSLCFVSFQVPTWTRSAAGLPPIFAWLPDIAALLTRERTHFVRFNRTVTSWRQYLSQTVIGRHIRP